MSSHFNPLKVIFFVPSLLIDALKPPKPVTVLPPPGSEALRQTIPGRQWGTGYDRLGSNKDTAVMLYEADERFYRVYAIQDCAAIVNGVVHIVPIDGFERFYLDDDEVTVSLIDDEPYRSGIVAVGHDGRYGSNAISFQTRAGVATNSNYSDITAAIPTLWPENARGDGIASIAVICDQGGPDNQQLIYPNGGPQASTVPRLARRWDPRDPDQIFTTPSTWKWGRNAALNHLAWEMTRRGRPDSLVDVDAWKAAADVCDEAVAIAGTLDTEPRYQQDGSHNTQATDPADVRAMYLAAYDGWVALLPDGRLTVLAGKYTAPTVTIGPDDIFEFEMERYVPDEEAVNVVVPQYVDNQQYTVVPTDAWRDEEDITDRGAERSADLSLPFVQSWRQARRLGKREWLRQAGPLVDGKRVPARGSCRCGVYGLSVLAERWITLSPPGFSSMVVEVLSPTVAFTPPGVTFTWRQAAPDEMDAWDPDAEEGQDPTPVVDTAEVHDIETPDAESVTGETGAGVPGPLIQIVMNTPVMTGLTLRAHVQRTGYAGVNYTWPVDYSDSTFTVETPSLTAETTYYVSLAFLKGTTAGPDDPDGPYEVAVGEVVSEAADPGDIATPFVALVDF